MEYSLSTCCGLFLLQPPVVFHPEEDEDLVPAACPHQVVACRHQEVQGPEVVVGEEDLDRCTSVHLLEDLCPSQEVKACLVCCDLSVPRRCIWSTKWDQCHKSRAQQRGIEEM